MAKKLMCFLNINPETSYVTRVLMEKAIKSQTEIQFDVKFRFETERCQGNRSTGRTDDQPAFRRVLSYVTPFTLFSPVSQV